MEGIYKRCQVAGRIGLQFVGRLNVVCRVAPGLPAHLAMTPVRVPSFDQLLKEISTTCVDFWVYSSRPGTRAS